MVGLERSDRLQVTCRRGGRNPHESGAHRRLRERSSIGSIELEPYGRTRDEALDFRTFGTPNQA